MRNLIRTVSLGLAVLALSACSGGFTKLSVLDRDETPRTAAVALSDDLTPALEDLADLCEVGVLGDDTQAAVATHGPVLVDAFTAYFESAEQCVVIDGALQSDPTVAGACTRGSVRAVSRSLPAELRDAATAFGLGTDIGRGLYLASVVTRRTIGSNDGGVIDGFAKDDELSAGEYFLALAPLRAARDRVAACVGRSAG